MSGLGMFFRFQDVTGLSIHLFANRW